LNILNHGLIRLANLAQYYAHFNGPVKIIVPGKARAEKWEHQLQDAVIVLLGKGTPKEEMMTLYMLRDVSENAFTCVA